MYRHVPRTDQHQQQFRAAVFDAVCTHISRIFDFKFYIVRAYVYVALLCITKKESKFSISTPLLSRDQYSSIVDYFAKI